MIEGKIKDLKGYVPNDMHSFIDSLNNISVGKYYFENGNYANVEEYTSKPLTDGKYEVHRQYNDIQIVLSGKEKIYIKDLSTLKNSNGYIEDRDIEFFEDKIYESDCVVLDGTNFVFIPPQDGHAPQIQYEKPGKIKKVVLKIKV